MFINVFKWFLYYYLLKLFNILINVSIVQLVNRSNNFPQTLCFEENSCSLLNSSKKIFNNSIYKYYNITIFSTHR